MSKKVSSVSPSEVLRYHWRHAMAFPKQVAVSFIVAPLSIILERYVSALIIASLLASIQGGTVTLESSIWLLVGYAAILLVSMIIGYRVNLFAMWGVQVRGARTIYNESFETLTQHSLHFFNTTFTGSLVSKVSKFASSFISFWNAVIFEVLFVTTAIVATLVGLSFIMWQYALALFVLVVLYIFTAFYSSRFLRPRQKARSEAYTKISAQLADAVGNMMAIKTDGREQYEQNRLRTAVNSMVTKEFAVRSGIVKVSTIHSSVISVMRISALLASIMMIQLGIADAALVYLALTFTINLVEELGRVQSTLRSYYQIVGDSEEMLEIMRQPIDIQDSGTNTLAVKKGRVELDSLSFHYQDDAKSPVFDGLSLTVEGGQSVGVVGASGAGKTSLTKLLLRFLDPTEGEIRIDGQGIAEVTQASLHKAISYVPQEPLLFHRSLKENIAYGRPNASEEEIRDAAIQANALDFIEKLPEGFDTLVGERGVKLSGGQRQRIAIARAILKDAPILVLDEATSALDSESEKLIQKALRQLMKGRTSFVIAHRLSTIARLDRIIVMENGAIIEDGSHEELLAQKGRYASLWAHQSGGFIED